MTPSKIQERLAAIREQLKSVEQMANELRADVNKDFDEKDAKLKGQLSDEVYWDTLEGRTHMAVINSLNDFIFALEVAADELPLDDDEEQPYGLQEA